MGIELTESCGKSGLKVLIDFKTSTFGGQKSKKVRMLVAHN